MYLLFDGSLDVIFSYHWMMVYHQLARLDLQHAS